MLPFIRSNNSEIFCRNVHYRYTKRETIYYSGQGQHEDVFAGNEKRK